MFYLGYEHSLSPCCWEVASPESNDAEAPETFESTDNSHQAYNGIAHDPTFARTDINGNTFACTDVEQYNPVFVKEGCWPMESQVIMMSAQPPNRQVFMKVPAVWTQILLQSQTRKMVSSLAAETEGTHHSDLNKITKRQCSVCNRIAKDTIIAHTDRNDNLIPHKSCGTLDSIGVGSTL